MNNLQLEHFAGFAAVIQPGQNINIDCAAFSPTSGPIRADKIKIDDATLVIELSYRADFFGWFSLQRNPSPTRFTWFSGAANPQWIKGEFTK
jgi:hypothetical protein